MIRILSFLTFLVFFISLSGCALPIPLLPSVPALTYASYGRTGIDFASFTATGKTTGDHALSAITGLDCNFFGIFTAEKFEYRFHQQRIDAENKLLTSNFRGICK
jgi:hypothetical protein